MLSQSFGLSSATMRNEMGELERSGYIFQPHTSAGRVPTEEGYRFYVKHHIANAKIGRRESQAIASLLDQEINPRRVARLLAQLTEQTMYIGFGKHDVYVTGLSYLFSKPEFASTSLGTHIAEILDNLENGITALFDDVETLSVLIGNETPFSPFCSTILFRARTSQHELLFGLLGPMRMDYSKNYSLMRYAHSEIERRFEICAQ